MKAQQRFSAAIDALPLVAILRGLQPHEAAGVGTALVGAGLKLFPAEMIPPAAVKGLDAAQVASNARDFAAAWAGTIRA